MSGIIKFLFNLVLNVNGAVTVIFGLVVWYFTSFLLGIATIVLICLIIITHPKLNIKLGQNDWTFGIPIFPGAGFFKVSLALILLYTFFTVFLGEELTDSYIGDLNSFRSKKVAEKQIETITPGSIFYIKTRQWEKIDKKITGRFLNEEKETTTGEKIRKYQLEGSTKGVYNGIEVWVPILQTERSSIFGDISKNFLKKEMMDKKSPPSGDGEKKSHSSDKNKNSIICLSSEEVVLQDFHQTSDKLMVNLGDYFQKGDLIEVVDDFSLQVENSQPESWMIIGGRVYSSIFGNPAKIKKGTRFVFLDKQVNFGVYSNGDQFGFSGLKLRKIRNIL